MTNPIRKVKKRHGHRYNMCKHGSKLGYCFLGQHQYGTLEHCKCGKRKPTPTERKKR